MKKRRPIATSRKKKLTSGEIDKTRDHLICLAMARLRASGESERAVRFAALEAAVVGLDPSTRAAIVEYLDSPGRLQRIRDWYGFVLSDPGAKRLVQGDPATVERRVEFAGAMVREAATEIVWRLAANKDLPPYLA